MTQSEATLPYAALERLLRGLLAGVESLPLRQRAAVLSGLGTADGLVTDRFPIGPLVALVDDAHWLGPRKRGGARVRRPPNLSV